MKKGFTMVELIFVIVILGILAAIAIPRLNATRMDAEVTKALADIGTARNDFSTYYTSQGKFADNIKDMTDVTLTATTLAAPYDKMTAYYETQGKKCIVFYIAEPNVTTKAPAYLQIRKSTQTDVNSEICQMLYKQSEMKEILKHSFTYINSTGAEVTIPNNTISVPGNRDGGFYPIGGINVKR